MMALDVCHLCHMTIPPTDVIENASTQINRQVSYVQTKDITICPTCISIYIQMRRIEHSEEKLLSVYTRTLKLHQYEWSEKKQVLDASRIFSDIMGIDCHASDYISNELCSNFFYRTIKVKEIFHNYNEIATSIMGASLPPNVDVTTLNPNLVCCPEHDFGFIKLPRNKDFIIITKSNFNELSVLEQSLNEMKHISKGTIASRSGAAGGVMLPLNKCQSLSKVTQNDRVLCVRKKSVGMSVSYRNKEGIVKGRNAIYNDLYMKRYNSKQKLRLVKSSLAYQRLLIREMVSRLKAFLILDREQLIPIQKSLEGFRRNDKHRLMMEKTFVTMGRTVIESKLLSWACTTGEMRNHQAVKAHVDGNKSHPVETMSIFGRLPIDSKRLTADYVREMKPGFLLLPLEGMTLKMLCGYDLIHCCLKSTVHLADNTRNTCNWTKVHGP